MMDGLIPLGSCTMKHTPVDAMDKTLDEIMNIHPYVELCKTNYEKVINRLSDKLKEITGFDHISYQSQSGAMGEYSGLYTMKKYHESNSNNERTKLLMPKSAHGTNASSAKLAGYDIVYLKENKNGMIDIEDFNRITKKHSTNIAGLMITYPSTYGLYEENIGYINKTIHSLGGLVYMDGANMNALIGKPGKPVNLGFDICHFNLHKTFAIPHGGGGPGMGPIGVINKLHDYLPKFSTTKDVESISTTPYGSGLILQISDTYLEELFKSNLTDYHINLIKRTKYIMKRLSEKYSIYHYDSPYRAHEFIINTSMFRECGITENDISKRLLDYGIHAPTMSWPILSSLMIEVTESETEEEVERFIDAMLSIHDEIYRDSNLLKNAPHTTLDIVDWKYDYSIMEACYPMGDSMIDKKFWPTRNRVNDAYGDKLFNN